MRDPELTRRARGMRKEMTEPETRLWLQLRAKRFDGAKFRRQKVIQDEQHRYIVDFAANDPKLVIELDGDTHAGREAYDEASTRFLESKGYRVLRYTNVEVMQNLDGVLQHLASVIDEMRSRLSEAFSKGHPAVVTFINAGDADTAANLDALGVEM